MGATRDFEDLVFYLGKLDRNEENFGKVKKILRHNPALIFWKLKSPFCVRCRKSMFRDDALTCKMCGDK